MDSLLDFALKKEIAQAKKEVDLFKEDSILTAIFITYSKFVGLQYLWRVLAETLHDVAEVSGEKEQDSCHDSNRDTFLNPKSFEVDINKLSENDDRFINVLHLKLAA